jgi:hypothetical protein
LLDECLPRKLRQLLPGHHVLTVPEMGWAGIKNGPLLQLAEPAFDVFMTIDGNLQYQQNLRSTTLAIIALAAHDNTFESLEPLMPKVLVVLESISPSTFTRVELQ